jgi:hypothetical protein
LVEVRHRQLTPLCALVAAALLAVACYGASSLVVAGPPVASRSPTWAELSPANKAALAPLASQWDQLDAQRKQTWLGIVQRYPKMPPAQQERVQQQMGVWAGLTPDQRRIAREQYKSLKQLPPEERRAVREKWQEYQQLPPEKRRELARKGENATAAGKPKAPAPGPAPATAPAPPAANR